MKGIFASGVCFLCNLYFWFYLASLMPSNYIHQWYAFPTILTALFCTVGLPVIVEQIINKR